jgi:hypothetical protein
MERPSQRPFEIKKCRACGATMHMAEGPNGAIIPLVKVRKLYVRPNELREQRVVESTIMDSTEKYVSHFETCTDPNRFSRSKKK